MTYDTYLPMVRRVALRLIRTVPPSVMLDDLINVGWMGLVDALNRRPPDMTEEHFKSFAYVRIRGSMMDHLRQLDPLSRSLRRTFKGIQKTTRRLTLTLGRTPEPEEVSQALGVTLDVYHGLLRDMAESGEESSEDYSRFHSPDPSPETQAADLELQELVNKASEALPDRLNLVLGLHYREEFSFRDVGIVLGVTESRICQLHIEALAKIKNSLAQ